MENLIESTTYGNGESPPREATSTTIGILGENGERLILRLCASLFEGGGEVLDKVFDLGSAVTLWLSSPANRRRLRGARIEVIAAVVCREPKPSILLGKSPYHNTWMPPQEGVYIKETFKEALLRCLEVECGLDLPEEERALDRALYLRSIRYVGSIDLPKERHGERLVADDAIGTPLESVTLKRKAYWLATLILESQAKIEPKADGRELLDVKWFGMSEAHEAIRTTNSPKKVNLLEKCLEMCGRDLHGSTNNHNRDHN